MRDCTVRAPRDFRCNHKAVELSSPTTSFSAEGAPGGGVDAKASGEESMRGPDGLHHFAVALRGVSSLRPCRATPPPGTRYAH